MKVSFVVLEPESKRGTYEVPLPVVVGRGNEARFRIQQDRISRKHCELFERDGDVYVRDLGSTNGTFLDGEQIVVSIRTPVPPGSILRVGTIDIRIDYAGSGRLAPVAPSTPAVEQHATTDFAPVAESETADVVPSFDVGVPVEAEELPELVIEAAPAAGVAEAVEKRKSPEPRDFGGLDAGEPVIEAFDPAAFGGGAAEAEPPADGSFEFLAGSKEEQPAADADLDDFFKGLK